MHILLANNEQKDNLKKNEAKKWCAQSDFIEFRISYKKNLVIVSRALGKTDITNMPKT